MNKFIEAINDMVEFITGERPEQETERAKGYTTEHTKQWLDSVKKPKRKRARDENGRYIGDDPTTEDVNEAWVSPFPTPKPSIKWTKKQLIGYCNEFGVLHSSYDNKKQLLEKISETYPNGI